MYLTPPPLPGTPADDVDDDDAVLSSPGGVMFSRKGLDDPNPNPSSSSSPNPNPPLFASVRGVRVVTALGAGLKTVVLLFSLVLEGDWWW